MSKHISVLLNETVQALKPQPGNCLIDGTLGAGGHSLALYSAIQPDGRLFSLDRDPEAVKFVNSEFPSNQFPNWERLVGRVSDQISNLPDRVNGILFDSGWSGRQLDSGRGFSFSADDDPLDLRYSDFDGSGQPIMMAQDWLNQAKETEIDWVLARYGEEPLHTALARAIAISRPQGVKALVNVIRLEYRRAYGPKPSRRHPATKTWQALRLFINQEVETLEQDILAGLNLLASGGQMAVITFHSLEDKLVKSLFRWLVRQPETGTVPKPWLELPRGWSFPDVSEIVPSEAEIKNNPASQSARLRLIKKV